MIGTPFALFHAIRVSRVEKSVEYVDNPEKQLEKMEELGKYSRNGTERGEYLPVNG